MTLDRDTAATDALLTDLYLDALLAGAVLGGGAAGTPDDAARQLDPAARRAADRLRHDLVRVHPSFRFEERLATRLAEAAVAMRVPIAAGDVGRIVPFRALPAIELDPGLVPPESLEEPAAPGLPGHIAVEMDPARRGAAGRCSSAAP